MIIVVSPAKKLDFESPAPIDFFSHPKFLSQSETLIDELKKCNSSKISKMMKLSDTLTKLNMDRYKSFETPFTIDNSKQAMFAFKGDTYVGLDAETMKKSQVKYADKHLRILSGLYGLLSPTDLIQPYRLEMGTKFSCNGNKNLYEFWKNDITKELNTLLQNEKVLVNLSSKEYFSVIDFNSLNAQVITPTFKERKGDEYKIVGIFAKRARGMFSRFIIDNRIKKIEDLKTFNIDNYKFNKELSNNGELVFTRG